MKFKNYCVVIMGNTNGVLREIEKISEDEPKILDAKGLIIATFTSFVDVKEITAWFKLNNRSFFVFDLDKNNSGYFITKKEIHEGLFGFLNNINEDDLDNKTSDFLNIMGNNQYVDSDFQEIKTTEKTNKYGNLNESEILKMSKDQKDELFNTIIDSGFENLTEYDKKILQILSK